MKDQPRFIIHSDGTIEQIIEPCENCICRQQAIDKMQELEEEDIEAYGCSIPEGFDGKRAIEALKTLPSVQPIPANEKEIYNKGWKDGAEAAAYHYELCIEEIKADIAEFMEKIPTLGNCKEGWHNAGQRIELEQACEIIDNHIAESEGKG